MEIAAAERHPKKHPGKSRALQSLQKDFRMHKFLYLLALPVVAYYIIFHYVPMYGIVIAWKDYSPMRGILGSDWAGWVNFKDLMTDPIFGRSVRNTILLNVYGLLWGFPAPIVLALLLNELGGKWFKKITQTVTYLPHFISVMVIVGMIVDFSATDGIFNDFLVKFGAQRCNLLTKPELFRTIYISTGIWQGIGFGSIIYLAALSGINPELYEAAVIDGAGRWKQMLHVTLPGIAPTIIIMLILRMGRIMSVGFDKVFLMYNPLTYETADVISTYVYRIGLVNGSYSYSTAVGLFNSIINCLMLVLANKVSKMVTETSLW